MPFRLPGISYPGSGLLNLFDVTTYKRSIDAAQDFLHLKTGPLGKQAYWYYNGVVRNPLTGMEVAGIEGVEIVRPFAIPVVQNNPKFANGTRLGSSFAGSYLSKKVFVYVDKTNRTNVIEKFRVRHHAPLRTVNPVKQFAELVTVGVEPSGSTFATVLWPTGRLLRTNKIRITQSPESISPLEAVMGRKKVHVINFMSAAMRRTGIGRHPLSKWISFSPTSDDGTTGRTQEYYTISNAGSLPEVPSSPSPPPGMQAQPHVPTTHSSGSKDGKSLSAKLQINVKTSYLNDMRQITTSKETLAHKLMQSFHPKPSAVLSYRRYGEGPSWFSVGRACVVEMNGARYDRPQALPASVRALVDRVQPDFFAVGTMKSLETARQDKSGTAPASTSSPPFKDISAPSKDKTLLSKQKIVHKKDITVDTLNERGRRMGGTLSKQWFAEQTDLADSYKPWYFSLFSFKKK